MKKILIIANVLIIGAFLIKMVSIPPQLPLFYSLPWGEDQLVDSWMILILPLLMDVFFFLNEFIKNKLFGENVFAKKIIDYFNIFLVISLAVIFLKIVLLLA